MSKISGPLGFSIAAPYSGSSSYVRPTAPSSGNEFLTKLEKHIDDVSKKQGHLSKQTGIDLTSKHRENAQLLSRINPEASTLYSAYTTGLSYDKKARFIRSIKDSTESISKLQQAVDKSESDRSILNEIYSEKQLETTSSD